MQDWHHLVPRSRVRFLKYPREWIVKIDYVIHHFWHDVFTSSMPHEVILILLKVIFLDKRHSFGILKIEYKIEVNASIFERNNSNQSKRLIRDIRRKVSSKDFVPKWRYSKKRYKIFSFLFKNLDPIDIINMVVKYWTPKNYYNYLSIKILGQDFEDHYLYARKN